VAELPNSNKFCFGEPEKKFGGWLDNILNS
jgi:hypothetical protein